MNSLIVIDKRLRSSCGVVFAVSRQYFRPQRRRVCLTHTRQWQFLATNWFSFCVVSTCEATYRFGTELVERPDEHLLALHVCAHLVKIKTDEKVWKEEKKKRFKLLLLTKICPSGRVYQSRRRPF